MKAKKVLSAILVICMVISAVPAVPALAADDAESPAFQVLERVETIVYGSIQGGGLLARLSNVERDVFGMELPGSLTERQTAMLNFLENGSESQPSLLFKLSVAEWGVNQEINPETGIVHRVDAMESLVEGTVQGGAYAARVERIIGRLLPDGVVASTVEVPAGTVVKSQLTKELTVKTVKKDDPIILRLHEEIVVDGNLFAPKGSRVFGHISKVRPPRSFGRASEIEITFDSVESIGPSTIPVVMGEAAKKAMEADAALIGAAGLSFAGAVLLGPLGLATGVLVRGSDKPLKEGTLFYVETAEPVTTTVYAIPPQIQRMVRPVSEDAPQGTVDLK